MLQTEPKRILVTRLRFIGDVVLTTPVIRALRKAYPQADIYYLAEPVPVSILANDPDLTGIIPLIDTTELTGSLSSRWLEIIRFYRELRSYKFDLVIDLFSNPRSAGLTFLSGATYRVGYDVRVRGALYNIKIKRGDSIRVTDAYLDAIRTLGIPVDDDRPRLTVSRDDQEWATALLNDYFDADAKLIIGINPGGSWPAKRWGAGAFADLIEILQERFVARIIMIEGPGQNKITEAVTQLLNAPVDVLAPDTLPHLAAVINQCSLFISNDSGPMHIAAAVGVSTIGLFGPSRPDIWFPYSRTDGHVSHDPGIQDCCGKDICERDSPCINMISVDEVVKSAEELLAGLD